MQRTLINLRRVVLMNTSIRESEPIKSLVATKDKYRILVLDGGGMRGLLTAGYLRKIEQDFPDAIQKADLIVGTSIGGLLATYLANGDSASQMYNTVHNNATKIFYKKAGFEALRRYGGLFSARFSPEPLRQVISDSGFDGVTLGCLQKKVMISAFDINSRDSTPSWRAKFFHNFNDIDGQVSVHEACMATSAAPTIFPVSNGYVDGGVVCNHPVVPAIAQAMMPKYGNQRIEDLVVLNIGTGDFQHTLNKPLNASLGMFGWSSSLIGILFHGQHEVNAFTAQALLGDRFHRLSPLASDISAWSSSKKNIDAIEQIVEKDSKDEYEECAQFIRDKWN